ncbi:HNH endonuclease signature motif containing protein [Nocardioides limicola]|uniref:HNH endonuclease signature motif containing protein n=1 Tax=Nocardioides limicola TaxID=2803368 RepID=UPI00193C5613|nr:HNH endonuclease signature motif containing protein [Nocardioides sp. DJM-14]
MKAALLEELDTSAEVVDFIRAQRRIAQAAEAAEMLAAVKYCGINAPADAGDVAALDRFLGADLQLGGEGVPTVSESAVIEYAAALGRSTESAKRHLGECLELAYRLRRTWARVVAGEVPGWAARRIAARTQHLPAAGAAWVDGQVVHCAGRIGPTALDRVLDEALTRFDPEEAENRRLDALDRRHLEIELSAIIDGQVATADVHGTLDAADALDLEAAVARLAQQYRDLGSTDPLNVRRAKALGELARTQHGLDLASDGGGRTPPRSSAALDHRPTRRVVLHVHLSQDAVRGFGDPVVRVESMLGSRDRLVTVEQLSEWCSEAAEVTVRPVLDLHETLVSTGYQPSDRLREQVIALNPTCVFPYCHRPATRADLDHIEPWRDDGGGGATSTQNLAPLCRTHHRAKTHLGWTYTMVIPGEYLWRSPQGRNYHRGPDGTSQIDDGCGGLDTPPRPSAALDHRDGAVLDHRDGAVLDHRDTPRP